MATTGCTLSFVKPKGHVLKCGFRGNRRPTLSDVLAVRPSKCAVPTTLGIDSDTTIPRLRVGYPASWTKDERAVRNRALQWAFRMPICEVESESDALELSISTLQTRAIIARRVVRTILRGDLEKALLA